jgi:predicted ATPase
MPNYCVTISVSCRSFPPNHRQSQRRHLELRATICLARLLAAQDRREEARAMLAEIYNWFSEGFDTADLKEAKGLLDELATGHAA